MDFFTPILYSPALQFVIGMIQIIGPIFFSAVLVLIVFCIFKSDFFNMAVWIDIKEFIKIRGYDTGPLEKRLKRITSRLESPNMADWKLAVIETEALTEGVLARMGFGGDSFGERLKKIRLEQLPNLEDLTNAHQVRNNIVHDPDYRIDLAEITKTIAVYEKSLELLDAL